MKLYRLEREQIIPRSRAETFAFFANPRNLEPLTPPSLHFRFVVPPPPVLMVGTILQYRIRLYGIGVAWQSKIEVFEPPRRFVDSQLKGPYALWRHSHVFDEAGAELTRVRDAVEFAMPMGPLGTLAYYLFVAGNLKRIFDFRAERLRALL